MKAVYRNLTRGGWSVVDASLTRNGHATKGKGPSHETGGIIMRDITTNNPKSIGTGCARILRNIANPNTSATREVVAYVAGDVAMGPRPTELIRLGVLTLDLQRGCFLIVADSGSKAVFDLSKMPETLCLAFNEKCEVFI